jgi:hypothetical protein
LLEIESAVGWRTPSARYGHSPKHIFGTGFGLAMSAAMLLIPAPLWARVFVVVTVGGASVMLAMITLRVDAAGVTIRPYTLPASVLLFYPWDDVVQFVIIRAKSKEQFVHIRLREGAQLTALNRLSSLLQSPASRRRFGSSMRQRVPSSAPRLDSRAAEGWTLLLWTQASWLVSARSRSCRG